MQTRRAILAGVALLGVAAVVGIGVWRLQVRSAPAPAQDIPPPAPARPRAPATLDPNIVVPSELTVWPWPGAKTQELRSGVTYTFARQKDGTALDLLRFDFAKNPRLRFELYAQDEDDAKPWDNVVQFWPMGVGQAVRHFTQKGRGPIVAAWNGPFFGYYRSAPIPKETAFHLAPVVVRGVVKHNTGNHRWTFGVKMEGGKPRFKVFHLPGRPLLEKEFDFASGTIQCLIKDGKKLRLQPFPAPGTEFPAQPFPSTPQEVGHIPYFDHAKFSRASMGWSKDSQQLYMLLVREPQGDTEGISIRGLTDGVPQGRGWNVADLQRFWGAMQERGLIWNAINSDAGDVGQLAYIQPNGKYQLVSPQGDNPSFERREFSPQFEGAPQGGALMYFYVREEK